MTSRQVKHDEQEIKSALDVSRSLPDRIALFITDLFGSIVFLNGCLLLFAIWITWNLDIIPGVHPFDRYPFPALDMGVSLFAIILSVSVLISQNRQGKLEKARQLVEFEINVRAEKEITKILHMLHDMQKKMGINTNDSELEGMKKDIDLQRLHEQMGEAEDTP